MDVETDLEVKEIAVFKTSTHIFKIDHTKLAELRKAKSFESKIMKKIQKGLRLNAEAGNGNQWQESVDSIYNHIVYGTE